MKIINILKEINNIKGTEKKIHFWNKFNFPIDSKTIKFESSKTYIEKKDTTNAYIKRGSMFGNEKNWLRLKKSSLLPKNKMFLILKYRLKNKG